MKNRLILWPDKDLRDFKAELLSVFGNHKIGMFAVLAQIPVFTQKCAASSAKKRSRLFCSGRVNVCFL
jgi:hypothetical protein